MKTPVARRGADDGSMSGSLPGVTLAVGDLVEVSVGPVAHGGHFVARHEGRVIFVRHALPGERVLVRMTEDSGSFLRGDAVEVIQASPHRVEAPCLGKNVMAASNALARANMALSDFDPLIPLDEVIDAAKAVSIRMPREHRCTCLGGLSVTPTSLEIEQRLAGNQFRTAQIAFDPTNDRGRDRTKQRFRKKPIPLFENIDGKLVKVGEKQRPEDPEIDVRGSLPAIVFEPVQGGSPPGN